MQGILWKQIRYLKYLVIFKSKSANEYYLVTSTKDCHINISTKDQYINSEELLWYLKKLFNLCLKLGHYKEMLTTCCKKTLIVYRRTLLNLYSCEIFFFAKASSSRVFLVRKKSFSHGIHFTHNSCVLLVHEVQRQLYINIVQFISNRYFISEFCNFVKHSQYVSHI